MQNQCKDGREKKSAGRQKKSKQKFKRIYEMGGNTKKNPNIVGFHL